MTTAQHDSSAIDIGRLLSDARSPNIRVAVPAIDTLLCIAEAVAEPTIRRALQHRYLCGVDWKDGVQEALWLVATGLDTCTTLSPAGFGAWVRTISIRTATRMIVRSHREPPTIPLSDVPVALQVSDERRTHTTSVPNEVAPAALRSLPEMQLRSLGSTRDDAETWLRALPATAQTSLLMQALSRLNHDQRHVILLRLARRLSWPQMAHSLRTTPEAARRRFARAIGTLHRLTPPPSA